MSENKDIHHLERLYTQEIMLNKEDEKKATKVLENVLKQVIDIAKMKSEPFNELFREIYYGGSYYDQLKVKSTDFEFDLNIVFQTPKTSWMLRNLGDDVRKPNFANITCQPSVSKAWNELMVKDRQGNLAISPKKMFSVLHTAVDRALEEMKKSVNVNNEIFHVTRSTGAPVILNVNGPGVKFTVDLVPAFKLDLSHLKIACADLRGRVEDILRDFNLETKTFMAIALKNASVDMFEVDFHDIERGMLTRVGGCVYKVIKLIKYLRDTKGGTMTKLWSHLLKVRAYGKDQISNESLKYFLSDRCASSCSERKQEYLE